MTRTRELEIREMNILLPPLAISELIQEIDALREEIKDKNHTPLEWLIESYTSTGQFQEAFQKRSIEGYRLCYLDREISTFMTAYWQR